MGSFFPFNFHCLDDGRPTCSNRSMPRPQSQDNSRGAFAPVARPVIPALAAEPGPNRAISPPAAPSHAHAPNAQR